MSLAVRVIPCLDVDAGRVVKGVHFENLRDAGDPVELAAEYYRQGADELTFLDVTASSSHRQTMVDVVSRTAEQIFIPLTVGGGIRSKEDMRAALKAGADKVSMNSAAVQNPDIISECAEEFGSQCVVVAIDAKKDGESWNVYTHGGRNKVDLDCLEWAQKVEDLGAGEILLTSMDADGTTNGYDLELTEKIADQVNIPVIASGGCGTLEHIYEVFSQTNASAALAASIFHYGTYTVNDVKAYLRDKGVLVR